MNETNAGLLILSNPRWTQTAAAAVGSRPSSEGRAFSTALISSIAGGDMYIPSAVLGMWLRGIFSIAKIAAAVSLFSHWYRELPELSRQPNSEIDARQSSHMPEDATFRDRLPSWRPGLDRQTGYFATAILLSLLSLGGGNLCYSLLLRPGTNEPSSARSDRRMGLRRPDGTELNIEEFGKADGPAILLTHGWGVDSTEWYYVKKRLSGEYRVIVWDLPGTGRSSAAADKNYDLSRLAHHLQAVIDWSG